MRTPEGARGGRSKEPIRADGFFQFPGRTAGAVGAEAVEEGVELRPVVAVAQVGQFVEEDIVPQIGGQTHQIQVQVDVAFG